MSSTHTINTKLRLMDHLQVMAESAVNTLNGLNQFAVNTKSDRPRQGATYSLSEVKALPYMTPVRVADAMAAMENEGREFKRDESKRTLPFMFTLKDVRDIYHYSIPTFRERILKCGGDPSAKVIVGVNLKGGVGKTTTIATTASGLVNSRNLIQHQLKVLIIDLDPQASCSIAFGHSDISRSEESAAQAVLKKIDKDTLMTWVKPTISDGLHILPACTADAFFSVQAADFAVQEGVHMSELLSKYVIDPLRSEYDVILIDCGPHLDTQLINAMQCADSMLIPLGLDPLEFDSTLKFISRLPDLFDFIKTTRLTGEQIKFVATKMDIKNGKHFDNLQIGRALWPMNVLNSFMNDNNAFSVTFANQETIYDVPAKVYAQTLGVGAHLGKAKMDMDSLVNELFMMMIADKRVAGE